MGRLHRACTSGEGLGSLQQETGRCLKFTLDSLLLGDRKEKKGQKGGEQVWPALGQVGWHTTPSLLPPQRLLTGTHQTSCEVGQGFWSVSQSVSSEISTVWTTLRRQTAAVVSVFCAAHWYRSHICHCGLYKQDALAKQVGMGPTVRQFPASFPESHQRQSSGK